MKTLQKMLTKYPSYFKLSKTALSTKCNISEKTINSFRKTDWYKTNCLSYRNNKSLIV